jgi:hypothetical protein
MKTGTKIKIHSTEKCGCLGNDNAYLGFTGIIEQVPNQHKKHVVFYLDKYPKKGGWQPYVGCENCIKEVGK